jgi:hypothetical protein
MLRSVMSEPVECGRREQRALKQIGPFGECAVRRNDQCATFVPFIDHFIELLRPRRRQRFETEVVQDQDIGSRVGDAATPPARLPAASRLQSSTASLESPSQATGCVLKKADLRGDLHRVSEIRNAVLDRSNRVLTRSDRCPRQVERHRPVTSVRDPIAKSIEVLLPITVRA